MTAPPPGPGPDRTHELRAGAAMLALLAAVGVLAGLVWMWWSPARPQAYVLDVHSVAHLFTVSSLQPDETEAFVASDGRYMILMLGIGVSAGLLAWFAKPVRGPVMMAVLCVGGLIGAGLTALVGHVTGGGGDGIQAGTVVTARLTVHLSALYLLQAAAAVLVYAICVAFAADDDLGRPDPVRDRERAELVRH